MNRALSAAAVAFLLLLGPACGKDDDKNPVAPEPPPTPTYPLLSAPESALVALRLSYERRDSLAYRSCFAIDYQGTSYDTSETPGYQPASFTRIDEERHIRSLAENPNITVVTLDLGVPASWSRSTAAGDPGEDWALISVRNPLVEITEGDNTSEVTANETFEFLFRPTTPAPTSPTDTLWHIVRWTELP